MQRTISSESLFGLIGSDVHLNPKSLSAAVCDSDLDEASSSVPLWRIRQKTHKEKKAKKEERKGSNLEKHSAILDTCAMVLTFRSLKL
jgi:hypothetical protein